MKFGEFLNTMAAKLGLQNDTQLVLLLSNAQLANMEIGDDFAGKLRMVIGGGDDAPENPAPEPAPEAPAQEKPKSEPAKKTSRGGRRK